MDEYDPGSHQLPSVYTHSNTNMDDAPMILDLPRELVEVVGRSALASSPRDVLRFCQTCRSLHTRLVVLRAAAVARRLRFLQDNGDENDRTLMAANCRIESWLAGGLLPTAGISSWKIEVGKSRQNDGHGMWVGVCDATARCSWSMFLYTGRLRCACVDAAGRLDFKMLPPEGFPNGNRKQVMKPLGERSSLRNRANGAIIEVLVYHDTGMLRLRINGGQKQYVALPLCDDECRSQEEPRVFPPGAALRPFASCSYPGDYLRFMAIPSWQPRT